MDGTATAALACIFALSVWVKRLLSPREALNILPTPDSISIGVLVFTLGRDNESNGDGTAAASHSNPTCCNPQKGIYKALQPLIKKEFKVNMISLLKFINIDSSIDN